MMRWALGICASVLLITSTWAWTQETSVLVQQAQVVQQEIRKTLTVYGQVQADPNAVQTISLLHDGVINRVAVAPGQRVKLGDVLLELATTPGAHMEFLKARGAVDYAQSELNRQQRLFKEQLATKAQVEAARTALLDAQASLQALEAQGQNVTSNKVLSPAAGIITRVDVKQGDRLQSGTAVLEIAGGSHLVARLGVEPEDIRLIEPGTPVKIRSVFVPDYEADCRVREVHALINAETNLVDVLVPIPEEKSDGLVIRSSLIADIQLDVHNGLTVPPSAVLEDEQGVYVFRVDGNKARRVAVTTGVENDQFIEITSGLKPGENVVIVGNYELVDGMSIRLGG